MVTKYIPSTDYVENPKEDIAREAEIGRAHV